MKCDAHHSEFFGQTHKWNSPSALLGRFVSENENKVEVSQICHTAWDPACITVEQMWGKKKKKKGAGAQEDNLEADFKQLWSRWLFRFLIIPSIGIFPNSPLHIFVTLLQF